MTNDEAAPGLLTAQRCARLRDAFDHVVELPPEHRAPWIADHVADADDRAALTLLLRAAAIEGPLDLPPQERMRRLGDDEAVTPDGLIGQRIGAFRLTRLLGHGGMATVFLGRRDDGQFDQLAAVKLLRVGLYSAHEQRLFRRERQALAALSHPNIAHLIDGGITEAGVPYLVLEYIDGLPITEHALRHVLDRNARLRLFVTACLAVAAAHRQLIVHRDLKPANILVSVDGTVKLLDFGIAKLLDDDGETRSVATPMTPAYAAPEQIDGRPVTTATDVYALGIVLHELLLGSRPKPVAMRHAGVERPPQRPAPKTDRTALRGDLATILGKALEPEPERRYGSAAELAEDVEAFLASRPVRACPPTRWYRVRTFARRHRGGVLLTTVFALGVLASLAAALWQAREARAQAQRAERQTARAAAVRDLLIDLFDAEIPRGPRAQMPGTAELLERGAQRALTELDAQPAVQAELLTALGRVYDHLAQPDKGRPLLDAAVAAARRVHPPDPALLGAALSERGELDIASQRFDAAIVLLEDALALQRAAEPDGLPLAVTLDRLALANSRRGAHDQAIALYEEALELRRHRVAAGSPELLHSQHAIGNALLRAGRTADAEVLLRQAADGALTRFGQQHVKTTYYQTNHASSLILLRRYEEAAARLAPAVEAERVLYPPDNPVVLSAIHNLAAVELARGHLHRARALSQECSERYRAAGQSESLGLSFALGNLARADAALGDTVQAVASLHEAERSALAVVGGDHARTRTLRLQRLRLELASMPAAATELAALARELVGRPERLAQFRARSEPEAWFALGEALAALDQPGAAADAFAKALSVLPGDRVDPTLLFVVAGGARALAAVGRDREAEALLRTELARSGRELGASHHAVGELQLVLAETLVAREPGEAARLAAAAQSALTELPATHPWRARAAAVVDPRR